jgi:predicted transcriptional regulator YheO
MGRRSTAKRRIKMERKIKITVDLTDKGLYPMPNSIGFVASLIGKVFMDQPVCIDCICVSWIYED